MIYGPPSGDLRYDIKMFYKSVVRFVLFLCNWVVDYEKEIYCNKFFFIKIFIVFLLSKENNWPFFFKQTVVITFHFSRYPIEFQEKKNVMLFNPKSEFSIRYNSYDEMREYNAMLQSFYFFGEQRAALLMEKKEANCAQVDVVKNSVLQARPQETLS